MNNLQYRNELTKLALSELSRIGVKNPSKQHIKNMEKHFESMPFAQAVLNHLAN